MAPPPVVVVETKREEEESKEKKVVIPLERGRDARDPRRVDKEKERHRSLLDPFFALSPINLDDGLRIVGPSRRRYIRLVIPLERGRDARDPRRVDKEKEEEEQAEVEMLLLGLLLFSLGLDNDNWRRRHRSLLDPFFALSPINLDATGRQGEGGGGAGGSGDALTRWYRLEAKLADEGKAWTVAPEQRRCVFPAAAVVVVFAATFPPPKTSRL
jgi:hypothetical protein